jgi:hypothetical protein
MKREIDGKNRKEEASLSGSGVRKDYAVSSGKVMQ